MLSSTLQVSSALKRTVITLQLRCVHEGNNARAGMTPSVESSNRHREIAKRTYQALMMRGHFAEQVKKLERKSCTSMALWANHRKHGLVSQIWL
ncbi:hypothetical protein WJX77_010102 [Trebouxia sp. C0004]